MRQLGISLPISHQVLIPKLFGSFLQNFYTHIHIFIFKFFIFKTPFYLKYGQTLLLLINNLVAGHLPGKCERQSSLDGEDSVSSFLDSVSFSPGVSPNSRLF